MIKLVHWYYIILYLYLYLLLYLLLQKMEPYPNSTLRYGYAANYLLDGTNNAIIFQHIPWWVCWKQMVRQNIGRLH